MGLPPVVHRLILYPAPPTGHVELRAQFLHQGNNVIGIAHIRPGPYSGPHTPSCDGSWAQPIEDQIADTKWRPDSNQGTDTPLWMRTQCLVGHHRAQGMTYQ